MTLSLGAGRIPAFDDHRYVPVLLTRRGELHAMRELSTQARGRMTPLFVAHPISLDPDTRQPLSTVADHLGKLAKNLAKDWGKAPHSSTCSTSTPNTTPGSARTRWSGSLHAAPISVFP